MHNLPDHHSKHELWIAVAVGVTMSIIVACLMGVVIALDNSSTIGWWR